MIGTSRNSVVKSNQESGKPQLIGMMSHRMPDRQLDLTNIGERKPIRKLHANRNASYNLLNPSQPNPNYTRDIRQQPSGQFHQKREHTVKGRVLSARGGNSMGSILSYSNSLPYREDNSRMGGITGKPMQKVSMSTIDR